LKNQKKKSQSRTKKPKSGRVDIGEVMGLMEEKGRHKDWLLEEIKRHRVKLDVSVTTTSYEILKSSPKKIHHTSLSCFKRR